VRVFAATHPGLEEVLRGELLAMGVVAPEPEPGGIGFDADHRQLYHANLSLRTASRIVARVTTFRARTFAELERHAKKVAWEDLVGPGVAAHFRVTLNGSRPPSWVARPG
jgi:putative N6-adenine-specific DNA methylase